jgi:hypothetical protein
MKRISRIVAVGVVGLGLVVGGATLASAKGHHHHAHAKVADVIKDVKDTSKDAADAARDQAAAQSDVTTPDAPAEAQQEQADAQNEQADSQSEAQEGQQEGDNPAQAVACQGLLTDEVEYDDQTGTCTPKSGQTSGATGSAEETGGRPDTSQND